MKIFKDLNVDNLEFPRGNKKLNWNMTVSFKILYIFSDNWVCFCQN